MKRTVTKFALDSVSYRLTRDDETEAGSPHYWVEKCETDRGGAIRWAELHAKPIRVGATARENMPAGIPERVWATVLEKLIVGR